MADKIYFTYDEIHNSIKRVAHLVKEFNPDYIVAISGGGLIPARMLRTHCNVPILTVSMKLYDDKTHKPKDKPDYVQWLDDKNEQLLIGKRVIIVDEVDDTRTTLYNCVEQFLKYKLSGIGVFVVHNKLKDKMVDNLQDGVVYIAAEDVLDSWIVYPWDNLEDMEEHNNMAAKKYVLA